MILFLYAHMVSGVAIYLIGCSVLSWGLLIGSVYYVSECCEAILPDRAVLRGWSSVLDIHILFYITDGVTIVIFIIV
jgi:hypothetical protein